MAAANEVIANMSFEIFFAIGWTLLDRAVRSRRVIGFKVADRVRRGKSRISWRVSRLSAILIGEKEREND
jgi:hypothetical protein